MRDTIYTHFWTFYSKTFNYAYCGGIVGLTAYSYISNCYSSGDIQGNGVEKTTVTIQHETTCKYYAYTGWLGTSEESLKVALDVEIKYISDVYKNEINGNSYNNVNNYDYLLTYGNNYCNKRRSVSDPEISGSYRFNNNKLVDFNKLNVDYDKTFHYDENDDGCLRDSNPREVSSFKVFSKSVVLKSRYENCKNVQCYPQELLLDLKLPYVNNQGSTFSNSSILATLLGEKWGYSSDRNGAYPYLKSIYWN